MPDPSPALIETIARAIRKADTKYSPQAPQFDDDWMPDEDREDYRDMARAALAAMPQPVGYVGAWHEDNGWALDSEYGERLRPTAAQALEDCSDYNHPIDTVVAVVPVEGTPE